MNSLPNKALLTQLLNACSLFFSSRDYISGLGFASSDECFIVKPALAALATVCMSLGIARPSQACHHGPQPAPFGPHGQEAGCVPASSLGGGMTSATGRLAAVGAWELLLWPLSTHLRATPRRACPAQEAFPALLVAPDPPESLALQAPTTYGVEHLHECLTSVHVSIHKYMCLAHSRCSLNTRKMSGVRI